MKVPDNVSNFIHCFRTYTRSVHFQEQKDRGVEVLSLAGDLSKALVVVSALDLTY